MLTRTHRAPDFHRQDPRKRRPRVPRHVCHARDPPLPIRQGRQGRRWSSGWGRVGRLCGRVDAGRERAGQHRDGRMEGYGDGTKRWGLTIRYQGRSEGWSQQTESRAMRGGQPAFIVVRTYVGPRPQPREACGSRSPTHTRNLYHGAALLRSFTMTTQTQFAS
jgi:hypothetical protein